jgi:hypothetical protein
MVSISFAVTELANGMDSVQFILTKGPNEQSSTDALWGAMYVCCKRQAREKRGRREDVSQQANNSSLVCTRSKNKKANAMFLTGKQRLYLETFPFQSRVTIFFFCILLCGGAWIDRGCCSL